MYAVSRFTRSSAVEHTISFPMFADSIYLTRSKYPLANRRGLQLGLNVGWMDEIPDRCKKTENTGEVSSDPCGIERGETTIK